MPRKQLIKTAHLSGNPKRVGFITLVVAFILCCVLIATTVLPAPEKVALAEDHHVLLFEESGDSLILLLQSESGINAYYKDISDTSHALDGPYSLTECSGAFLRDGMIQLARFTEYFTLEQLSPESGYQLVENLTNYYDTSVSAEDRFAFSDSYDLLLAKPGETLLLFDCYGNDPIELAGLANVEFLASTPGGWIYAYGNGVLSRWQGAASYPQYEEYTVTCPVKLIGEDAFIDADGAVYLINGGVPVLVFSEESMAGLNTFKSYGTDLELFVADTSQRIHKYDWYGQELETAYVDGEVLATTSRYALVEKEGEIHLTWLEFHEAGEEPILTPEPIPSESEVSSEIPPSPPAEETDTPVQTPSPSSIPTGTPESTSTPEPEVSPTPDPPEEISPAPTPNLELIEKIGYAERTGENGSTYIMLWAGTRAEDLRRVKKPEAIKITDVMGETVYAGNLKTGMKAGDSTIVIRGDCTGSGTVVSDDIYFIEECMLDIAYFETEESYFAADMNADGKITTMDLVLVSREIARNTGLWGRGEVD